MKVKKNLENRIRGWLPKEPVFDGAQHRSKAQINKERDIDSKRIGMGILDVVGITLLGFSFYVYLVDPHAWRLAWIANVSFAVIGVISIALTVLIWIRNRRQIW